MKGMVFTGAKKLLPCHLRKNETSNFLVPSHSLKNQGFHRGGLCPWWGRRGGRGRVEWWSDLCLGTLRAEVWVRSSGPWRLEPLPRASGSPVLLTLPVGPRSGSLSVRVPVSKVTPMAEVSPHVLGDTHVWTTPMSKVTLSSEAGRISRSVCHPARLRPLSHSAWCVSPKAVTSAWLCQRCCWSEG